LHQSLSAGGAGAVVAAVAGFLHTDAR
jgi:hypothetical protein